MDRKRGPITINLLQPLEHGHGKSCNQVRSVVGGFSMRGVYRSRRRRRRRRRVTCSHQDYTVAKTFEAVGCVRTI